MEDNDYISFWENELWKMIVKLIAAINPVPTKFLLEFTDLLLPVVQKIASLILQSGVTPKALKKALIKPLIKKANLDPDVLGNYQPVSNLLYLSKILDRVASEQLWTHMDMNKLQVSFQLVLWSQQWPSLCSEWSSLNGWCCKQCLSCFAGLTSAFDKIDHSLHF